MQPAARPSLLAKISSEVESVLKAEAEAREREREEQLQRALEAAGGGAFPVLQPTPHSHTSSQTAQPHKVLSLNSKTKKVIVSTTVSRTNTPPLPVGPSAAEILAEEQELEDVVLPEIRKTRVLPPKVTLVHDERRGTERRWEPVRGGGAVYVQPPSASKNDKRSDASGEKKKRRGKGQAGGALTGATAST